MGPIGMPEIIVILVIALIFLGPSKLPELASGIGKAIREVRKATVDIRQEIELDETFRKPLEELREATMLAPEELKRRDEEKKWRAGWEKEQEEARKREAEQGIIEGADPAAHDPQYHSPDGTHDETGHEHIDPEPLSDSSLIALEGGNEPTVAVSPPAVSPPAVSPSPPTVSRTALFPGAVSAADRTIAMPSPPVMEGMPTTPGLPLPSGSSARRPTPPPVPSVPTGVVPRNPSATLYGMPAPSLPIPGVGSAPGRLPAPGLSRTAPTVPPPPADPTKKD